MEMTGERRIPAPRQQVWEALNDPEALRASIPGCESVERTADDAFTAKVGVKLGPMSAKFGGKVKLENINPPASYTISGEGNGGAMGFAKGGADVALEELGPAETLLKYNVKAQVGGKMAQLGARLIDSTAKQMADQFFDRFAALLTPAAPEAARPEMAEAAAPTGGFVTETAGAPEDAANMAAGAAMRSPARSRRDRHPCRRRGAWQHRRRDRHRVPRRRQRPRSAHPARRRGSERRRRQAGLSAEPPRGGRERDPPAAADAADRALRPAAAILGRLRADARHPRADVPVSAPDRPSASEGVNRPRPTTVTAQAVAGGATDLPESVEATQRLLAAGGYVADRALATTVHLALRMGRPLFLEGEPGTGKTEIAKVLAKELPRRLVRLQCYDGLDLSAAAYEWNHARQLMSIRLAEATGTVQDREALERGIYDRRFLQERPLLQALSPEGGPAVLLIDELDRADEPFEAFLLEILADFQLSVPELGTIKAAVAPIVIITSNRTREVHDAIRRRCLYHWVDYPDAARETRHPEDPRAGRAGGTSRPRLSPSCRSCAAATISSCRAWPRPSTGPRR
ncbi:SRPBCC domain-containing protein [Dankookia sp. P2]|uniref:SRPBCC domain-containing protein n=1 Tax=Dankookia sp. P2 TaxID=3423955 RepID=UPI003D666BCD